MSIECATTNHGETEFTNHRPVTVRCRSMVLVAVGAECKAAEGQCG